MVVVVVYGGGWWWCMVYGVWCGCVHVHMVVYGVDVCA